MIDPISVLVVDDSALMRSLVSRIVESTSGLVVADRAMNGLFALQKIPRCNPDIIVLDIEMPEMNGIEFLRERKRLGIEIPVIVLSSLAKRGAEITMEALALGASDFVTKPSGSISSDIHTVAEELSRLLLIYGNRYKKTKTVSTSTNVELNKHIDSVIFEKPVPQETKRAFEKITPVREPGPVEVIAIGVSTGGPNALRLVFSGLKKSLKQPILVVQHMPAGFTKEFAKSLGRFCDLDIREAIDGDIIKPGRILIAPGDYHLEVERRPLANVVRITESPYENGHRPSADVLFRSVAKVYGNRALGIIMTGMGKDGARELGSIYKEGGRTLGQDEASCIVYGMPKIAFDSGYVMEQVSLGKLANRILEITSQ